MTPLRLRCSPHSRPLENQPHTESNGAGVSTRVVRNDSVIQNIYGRAGLLPLPSDLRPLTSVLCPLTSSTAVDSLKLNGFCRPWVAIAHPFAPVHGAHLRGLVQHQIQP